MSKDKLIVIDPGHGGTDPGAVRSGIAEKDANLVIAQGVKKLLVELGYETHMTRETDKFVDLPSRTAFANVLEAALLVSIHCNSSDKPTAHGVETWHYPTDTLGREVASRIQGKLVEATGWHDRGVKSSQTFWMLRKTRMPAALVECGFVSNAAEAEGLNNEVMRSCIAEAIARAIDEVMRGV